MRTCTIMGAKFRSYTARSSTISYSREFQLLLPIRQTGAIFVVNSLPLPLVTSSQLTTISIHTKAFFVETSGNYVVRVRAGGLKVGRANTNEIFSLLFVRHI